MAESLKMKVKCHACGNLMEGTAKYGSGHYVAEGLDFQFTAVGRYIDKKTKQSRIRGEVVIICPNCEVRNQYEL